MPRPPPPLAALSNHGIAELLGQLLALPRRRSSGSSLPARIGTPAFVGDAAGGDLVAQLFEHLRRRADRR